VTENEVIEAACRFLEGRGYEIVQRLLTSERGVDIIARRPSGVSREIHVEAKGATSAREGSPRFGIQYGSTEVRINLAEAFYTAASATGQTVTRPHVVSAMALPDNQLYRRYVQAIAHTLDVLGIGVFWVQDARTVRFESGWEL
jgi:Holliday junction resolvase-like predicted endonuclease